MKRYTGFSLRPYNTFGFDVKTDEAVIAESVDDVCELARSGVLQSSSTLILGGGSNVLLRKDIEGLTVLNEIGGIEVMEDSVEGLTVRAGAGENWHEFAMWSVDRGLYGLENLSLIPGSVGAAPMQNIGAYGVELESVFKSLQAVDRVTGEVRVFTKDECEFGYRTSVFKTRLRNKYVIVTVDFELKKSGELNTSYGAIEQKLEERGISKPSVKDVSDAVIAIRESKLPNPEEIGNSGSFFKNPAVTNEKYRALKAEYPEIPGYPVPEGVKVAAGWMIDKAGWKGKRFNGYGVHDKQALVLVHYGNASGDDIYELSERIIEDIREKFGVTLEREVNVIP